MPGEDSIGAGEGLNKAAQKRAGRTGGERGAIMCIGEWGWRMGGEVWDTATSKKGRRENYQKES